MPTTTLERITAQVALENGTDSSGNIKTVNLSIGNLNEAYYSGNESTAQTKILAIVSALAPCLSKTVNAVKVTEVNRLVAS